MSPEVRAEFGRILSAARSFESVLEVGALPDTRTLLTLPQLDRCRERIGVNIKEEGQLGSIEVRRGDARDLAFADNSFDLVLTSSTLEHIPNFWLACAEMRRVLRPGGVLCVSVPGYVRNIPLLNQLQRMTRGLSFLNEFRRVTLTFRVHDHPHDYYRFSEEAVRHVLLEAFDDVQVWPLLTPPRLFGMGVKPLAPSSSNARRSSDDRTL